MTLAALQARLADHVERIDSDLALEFLMQQGVAAGGAKDAAWLAPATARARYGPELHATTAVIKLLAPPGGT